MPAKHFRSLIAAVLLLWTVTLLTWLPGVINAQPVTVPNIFVAGTSADANAVNENFATLAAAIPEVSDWTAFTAVWGGSTGQPSFPTGGVVQNTAFWRRIGDSMLLRVTLALSSPTGGASGQGEVLLQIPLGLSLDTSKQPFSPNTNAFNVVGNCSVLGSQSGGGTLHGTVHANAVHWLSFNAGNLNFSNTTLEWGSNQREFAFANTTSTPRISLLAQIPISEWTGGTTAAVGLYLFDEAGASDGSALGTVLDGANNPLNGTAAGGPVYSANVPAGFSGLSANFNGSGRMVTVSGSENGKFDLTSALTLEAWVYPEAINTGHDGFIVAKWDNYIVGTASYGLYMTNAGFPHFQIYTDALHEFDSSMQLTPNTWYHVAGVFDPTAVTGQQLKLVVTEEGGAPVTDFYPGTLSSTIVNDTAEPLVIGRYSGQGDRFFPGLINELRLTDQALSNAALGYNGSLAP